MAHRCSVYSKRNTRNTTASARLFHPNLTARPLYQTPPPPAARAALALFYVFLCAALWAWRGPGV